MGSQENRMFRPLMPKVFLMTCSSCVTLTLFASMSWNQYRPTKGDFFNGIGGI